MSSKRVNTPIETAEIAALDLEIGQLDEAMNALRDVYSPHMVLLYHTIFDLRNSVYDQRMLLAAEAGR